MGSSVVQPFVLEFRAPEVEEKPDLVAGRLQIVDHLGLVLGGQSPYRLDFQHDLALNNDVGKGNSNVLATERHFQLHLPGGIKVGLAKSKQQRFFVHAFEEARTELIENVETDPEDSSREIFMEHSSCLSCSSC